jgi:hypothetical protein
MVLTMAAVAVAKGIRRDGFSVTLRMKPLDHDGNGGTFVSVITLDQRYSRRERIILYNAARACEVHHLLRGPIEFREELAAPADGDPTA